MTNAVRNLLGFFLLRWTKFSSVSLLARCAVIPVENLIVTVVYRSCFCLVWFTEQLKSRRCVQHWPAIVQSSLKQQQQLVHADAIHNGLLTARRELFPCFILNVFCWICQVYRVQEKVVHLIFTALCTIVQSAVLRSHVVCPSVCLWRWWIMTT